MSLKNCKRCGRLYSFHGHSVCKHCLEKDNADFARIQDYLLTHPYVSALELSRETGVDPAVITRLQREGRFINREQQEGTLVCATCGALVPAGQLCQDCAKKRGLLKSTAKA